MCMFHKVMDQRNQIWSVFSKMIEFKIIFFMSPLCIDYNIDYNEARVPFAYDFRSRFDSQCKYCGGVVIQKHNSVTSSMFLH